MTGEQARADWGTPPTPGKQGPAGATQHTGGYRNLSSTTSPEASQVFPPQAGLGFLQHTPKAPQSIHCGVGAQASEDRGNPGSLLQ